MTHFDIVLRSLLQFEADKDLALERVMQELLTYFHSDTVTLHLLDKQKNVLVLRGCLGLPPEIEAITREIPIGKGIAGEAARTRKPVTTCNLQTDDSGVARPAARKTGVGGALCVPLFAGGELAGTLGIGTRREYTYTEEQTRALTSAGNAIVKELIHVPAR